MRIETYIEDAVCTSAEADGWLVRKLAWRGRAGAPDRLFVKGARVVFIEFKSPGEAPRPDQTREINDLVKHGAEVYVIDSIREGLKVLGL